MRPRRRTPVPKRGKTGRRSATRASCDQAIGTWAPQGSTATRCVYGFSRIRGQLVRFADYNAGLSLRRNGIFGVPSGKGSLSHPGFECDRYRLLLAGWRRFAITNAFIRKDVPTADHKNQAESTPATLANERSCPDNIFLGIAQAGTRPLLDGRLRPSIGGGGSKAASKVSRRGTPLVSSLE